jgi:8-oxo-dGTP pyrophosphatase MutT (NUDIX family)
MVRRLKAMPDHPLQIVCCLIFDDQNRLLLLRRHSEDLGGGLWATPGGRQEPDEDPLVTAMREVKEETGLDLKEVTYLGAHELHMPHGVVHMQTFRSTVKGDELIVVDPEEHEAHQWFAITDLLTAEKLIWGLPTTLLDFKLIESFEIDPTLVDGSRAILLEAIDQ